MMTLSRADSPYTTAVFRLAALEPGAEHTFTGIATNNSSVFKGSTLLESGLPVTLNEKPGVIVFSYKKH